MKISTKVRYATRAMLELALQPGPSPVLIETIARNQDLSKKYLETLLNTLKNNGLVRSIRGKGGGYKLNKDPKTITIKDIYIAIEGRYSVVECVDDYENCGRSDVCATRELWNEVSEAVLLIISGYTLSDLVDKTRAKQARFINMYYI
jgi:Rrf2 family transcriptional regulator, cysteine metabolism repressor